MPTFKTKLPHFGKFEKKLAKSFVSKTARMAYKAAAPKIMVTLQKATRNAAPAHGSSRKGAVASGKYLRGWRTKLVGLELVISNVVPYADTIEYGRKPGLPPPPPRELIGWVRRKLRLKPSDKVETVAYLIARAIGRRGLKARYVLLSAQPEIGLILAKATKNAAAQVMKESAT